MNRDSVGWRCTQRNGRTIVRCRQCGFENEFDQPYPYHAGFSDEVFLYNEAGNLTLIWGILDPAYRAIIGAEHPGVHNPEQQMRLESALLPSPIGDRWLFSNPGRCGRCREAIAGSILEDIYYLQYPGSIKTDAPGLSTFASVVRRTEREP